MFDQILQQLERVRASELRVELLSGEIRDHFQQVKLLLDDQTCIVMAKGFLAILENLPDEAGTAAVVHWVQRSAHRAECWAAVS